jgi:hypothetical protein
VVGDHRADEIGDRMGPEIRRDVADAQPPVGIRHVAVRRRGGGKRDRMPVGPATVLGEERRLVEPAVIIHDE